MTDLVDEYLTLAAQISELTARQKKIGEELLANATVGETLKGTSGKLRVQQNNNVDDAVLSSKLTPAMWRHVSARKSVAALLLAEIKRGKIPAEVVESSRMPGKLYLKKA